MKASEGLNRVQAWQSQRQRLQQDGTMLRFRAGVTSSSAVIPVSFDTDTESSTSHKTKQTEANRKQDLPLRFRARKVLRERPQACLDIKTIGGLRKDPFDAFPIQSNDGVHSAIDYCQLSTILL